MRAKNRGQKVKSENIMVKHMEKNNTFHESSWRTRSHRQNADKQKVLFTSFNIALTLSRLVNLCI